MADTDEVSTKSQDSEHASWEAFSASVAQELEADSSWQETIGIFGTHTNLPRGFNISRTTKLKRLQEILHIASHYDIVHGISPKDLRMLLEDLGPTFVKAGQILSMRSEILPPAFCDELALLRQDVEPMDRDEVLATLRAEYSEPIEELFDAIDDVPLGSASVAQVHKARLITGEIVAVKVQRPHVQEIMAQDISIMRSLAKRAAKLFGINQFLDFESVVDELWQSFRLETDFLIEAKSLAEFRANNADYASIAAPKPYLELCTEHVVVMDYVAGISIDNLAALKCAGYDLEQIGQALANNYADQILTDGFFHADPHPGNLLIAEGKIIYLDLGIMGRLSAHDRRAIKEMVYAVAKGDSVDLANGLLSFSIGPSSAVDYPMLLQDIDAILDDFSTLSLEELDLSQFLNALIAMAQKNAVKLPAQITMLARSLVTLEGVCNDLMPGVSIVEIISRHLEAKSDKFELAKRELKDMTVLTHRAARSGLVALGDMSLAMRQLTRGQLRFKIDLAGSTDPMADISHAADRLTMAIIIAGLFIGSSLIYYARIAPFVFGIPIIGLLGYLIALVLGLWIIFQIIKEGRRRS